MDQMSQVRANVALRFGNQRFGHKGQGTSVAAVAVHQDSGNKSEGKTGGGNICGEEGVTSQEGGEVTSVGLMFQVWANVIFTGPQVSCTCSPSYEERIMSVFAIFARHSSPITGFCRNVSFVVEVFHCFRASDVGMVGHFLSF